METKKEELATWRYPRPKVYVVLPAYNEEQNLGALIKEIDETLFEMKQDYEIVVVDDGSQDETVKVVEEFQEILPITLLKHEVNLGLGGTIRDGLKHASDICHDKDIVIVMDADNTHPAGLMRRMIRTVSEGNEVVIASRYQKASSVVGVPIHRQFLSYGAGLLFRIMFPIKGVKDYTCGYRAYRGHVLKRAFSAYGASLVSEEGFQCMVDILFKLRKLNIIFSEVPLVLRYDQKKGKSKMQVVKTIFGTLKLAIGRFFNQ